jgi:asparagine synthase (glutamine-hydrolysing)
MCGIAGLLYSDPSRTCEADVITRMRDVMRYRGPDDAGQFVQGPLGLGHRRLSIIDLGGGHQPMSDATGTLWIVFNGEIYNYQRLREELKSKGHRFRTCSDTEVILAAFREYGPSCVNALNGMFAFAIWDAERRSLFLARDRMGVKPLYYSATAQGFVFASEIKALFTSGLVHPRRRDDKLAEYMLFRQVAGPDTLFEGVRSLPPAHTLTVADGRSVESRYWSPKPSGPPPDLSPQAAADGLAELLEDSVRLRLISDVPVGTFCSGGVDSSLVTALAARLKGQGVNTFSIGFDETDYDESTYATRVSERYGTTHHQLRVGNVEFDDLFPRMVWHNDEPLDFANSVHIFALSELAKRYVTVVLTGEGSDELFGGYPRYRIPSLASWYRHVPAPLRRQVSRWTGDHRLRKLERYAALPLQETMLFNASYLGQEVVSALAPDLPPFESGFRQQCLDASSADADPVARLSLLDQETFLVSILHRQDKMSMAAGIESRVPFMDYRLVEFANSLPFRARRGVGKALVKDVARTLLPEDIVDRKKSGFGVPLNQWFRANEGLGARIQELPAHPGADLFDRTVLRRQIDEHRSGTHDHSEVLWTALNLCTWRESFQV